MFDLDDGVICQLKSRLHRKGGKLLRTVGQMRCVEQAPDLSVCASLSESEIHPRDRPALVESSDEHCFRLPPWHSS